MTPAELVLSKLQGAKKCGRSWKAKCPAHEDRMPSLSIAQGDDGRVLLKCHAGCPTEAVVSKLGLTMRDLMPDRDGSTNQNGKPKSDTPGKTFASAKLAVTELERKHGKRSAMWTYQDAEGKPVGLVVRWNIADGKTILPVSRHADGWRIAAMPDPRPLYHLPELMGASLVVVCEGEKAADGALSLGLVATTSSGGAQAPHKTDWRPLAGKTVWIFPDRDKPGREYAGLVAAILRDLDPATVVKIVELPGLPEAGDIVDWIAAHGDAATPDVMKAEIGLLAAEVEPLHGRPEGDREQWPVPIPLHPEFDPPEFPVEVLPEWLRNYVLALAEEKQVPADLPAMTALGASAAGIARKVVVTPWEGWYREPTNIFPMCCLPPGERKSQTFSAVFSPVKRLEAELRDRELPGILEAESRARIAQRRIDILEGKIAKEENAAERLKLDEDLKTAREELRAIVVPPHPVLRIDDDTPEMMALELVKQDGRLLAASPEARTLENIGRYSDKPNFDVFLKAHAGDDLRSGRIGRGRDSIDRPALTCVYTPQPCLLESLSESPEMHGRGFWARWFFSPPIPRVGFRKVRARAVPESVRLTYEAAMLSLWGVSYAGEDGEPHVLTFDPDAVAELIAFEQWKEILLRPGEKLSGCAGWGNKLGGLCVRLCGILHVADGVLAGERWKVTPISAGVVKRAVRLCRDYAIPHALAAFDRMGVSASIIGARAVLKWLGKRLDPYAEFSKRDVFNGCRGTFQTADDLQPALDLLVSHYQIRGKEAKSHTGPGRKPSPVFEVNPTAFLPGPDTQNTQNTHNQDETADDLHSAEGAYSADGGSGLPSDTTDSSTEFPFGANDPKTRDGGDGLFPDFRGLPD